MNISKQPPTVIDTPSSVNSFTDDSQVLINRIVTDNLDIWTSAIKKRSATGRGSNKKIELTGIKKLRELILELAVRGKLVPQDPNDLPAPQPEKWFVYVLECANGSYYKGFTQDILKRWKQHATGKGADWTAKYPPKKLVHWEEFDEKSDAIKREQELKSGYGTKWLGREITAGRTRQAGEPASVLLERIAAEKAQLIKDKKIKKTKVLPEIGEDEKLFELPDGWEWSRLGDFAYLEMGQSPSSKFYNQNRDGLPFFQGKADFGLIYPKPRYWCVRPQKYAFPNDVLLSVRAPVGPTNIANVECCIGRGLAAIRPLNGTPTMFILYSMRAFQSKLESFATGTTFVAVSKVHVENLIISIPPIEEQHRIVAKVDELMLLCDQLEQQTEDSITAHQTLVETLLATLSNSETPAAFNQNWTRIAAHFDTLFTTEHSIDQLKQTILQLAVMGKLVPQNSNDESASVLLEKIATEKEQLIKDKKIKKQKPLPAITDDEKPFELPSGWEWVILQNITSKITDGDHQTPPRISSGYKLLSAKNVRDGYLDMNNCDFIAEEHYVKSRERCFPECGDLLIVSVGGTIGRSSVVPTDSEFALVRSVALIKPLILNPFYFKYAMDSKLLQNSIHGRKRGGAQPCLYLSEIGKFPFSLPPLAEQHRIVKKVDELVTLCDQLKVRLSDAQTTQLHLANAIVEQAVN